MPPGHRDSQGTKGIRDPPARKVRKELEGRQEDLDRGRQDPRAVNDPVPPEIRGNRGYLAILATEERLEHQDRGEEKDMPGFQEIGGSSGKREIPATSVPLVLTDPPAPWEAGRVVHGS